MVYFSHQVAGGQIKVTVQEDGVGVDGPQKLKYLGHKITIVKQI